MADAATVRIIPPSGRRGAGAGGVDPGAVARAEAALQALSGEFAAWLEEEVARLEAARLRRRAAGEDAAALEELRLRAHDLKGLGGTSGFPLVTRACASLCRLLDREAAGTPTPPALVDAHVDAVRALMRQDAHDPAHAGGLALCEGLEARVTAHLGAGG